MYVIYVIYAYYICKKKRDCHMKCSVLILNSNKNVNQYYCYQNERKLEEEFSLKYSLFSLS
jgi:hypothetical protein